MKLLGLASAVVAASMMAAFTIHDDAAAASKKNVRDSLSAKQKSELRRKGREWCKKKYASDGQNYIDRVEIRRDGSIMCYIRGY